MKESRFLSHPEKRNHRRLDVDLDVNLVIDGKRIDTTATNISCGGMFVPIGEGVVSHDTQPPQEIEMMFIFPTPKNRSGFMAMWRAASLALLIRLARKAWPSSLKVYTTTISWPSTVLLKPIFIK